MFLQLHDNGDGEYNLPPLNQSENPFAPGAAPIQYESDVVPALGQAGTIDLPNALLIPTARGWLQAVEEAKGLYNKINAGLIKNPAEESENPPTRRQRRNQPQPTASTSSSGTTFAGVGAVIGVIVANAPAIVSVIQNLFFSFRASVVNDRVMQLYNINAYNVQNLNVMTRFELSQQIANLDADIATAYQSRNRINSAALSQFRLVYQQRWNQLGGVLGNWILPALGIGALAMLLFKK